MRGCAGVRDGVLAHGDAEEVAEGEALAPAVVLRAQYRAQVELEAGAALVEQGGAARLEEGQGVFGREDSGRGGAGRLCELDVKVGELGVAAPHLPGANRGLYFDAVDGVRLGLWAVFITADVDGVDGGHGNYYGQLASPVTWPRGGVATGQTVVHSRSCLC